MILVGSILLVVLGVVPATPWGLPLIAAAAAVEVGESLFWIWFSKRRRAAVGAEALIGRTARVVRACRPLGYVRLDGELWEARCAEGADRGADVRVTALDGLTLIVTR
ncbi:MAG TPA: NfeD family protein [Gaiellaceae bacterium]|nr:NfeD family protein [Gaiellaceae bacterium]